MKNILLFTSPFLVFGLILGVISIFGKEAILLTLYIFLVVGSLSFVGASIVANFGD